MEDKNRETVIADNIETAELLKTEVKDEEAEKL